MLQQFGFECGTCNAIYQLNGSDIGVSGAKITCPKCYTFFYFKPANDNLPTPIVEKIAQQDGIYEDTSVPPLPGEQTTETILNEAIESLSHVAIKEDTPLYYAEDPNHPNNINPFEAQNANATQTPAFTNNALDSNQAHFSNAAGESENISDRLYASTTNANQFDQINVNIGSSTQNTPNYAGDLTEDLPPQAALDLGLKEVTGNFYDPDTVLTQDSLTEYPEEPEVSSADRSIIWMTLIALLIAGIAFAHYNRFITIPMLSQFQKPQMINRTKSTQEVLLELKDDLDKEAKFGFPEVETLDENNLNSDLEQNQNIEDKTKPTEK